MKVLNTLTLPGLSKSTVLCLLMMYCTSDNVGHLYLNMTQCTQKGSVAILSALHLL